MFCPVLDLVVVGDDIVINRESQLSPCSSVNEAVWKSEKVWSYICDITKIIPSDRANVITLLPVFLFCDSGRWKIAGKLRQTFPSCSFIVDENGSTSHSQFKSSVTCTSKLKDQARMISHFIFMNFPSVLQTLLFWAILVGRETNACSNG